MSTTPEQINLWRSAPSEHQRLEFKEAKTQFDFRTLCIEARVVKSDEKVGGSREYACYLPFWA